MSSPAGRLKWCQLTFKVRDARRKAGVPKGRSGGAAQALTG
jgi:hypothetical protein